MLIMNKSLPLRVRLVREFWRGGARKGGEIFNLKCLVQFLEGEGMGGEQIFLKFDCIVIIILKLIQISILTL